MFEAVLHRIALSEVRAMPQAAVRAYPCRSCASLIGYALLAAGVILLFVCIPGWVWLALTGVGLIAAGWLILKLCSAWR